MIKSLCMRSASRVAVVLVGGIAMASAVAGGNGNGGNGSGGAHGAATSGMTYHSEPVSSPWNRVPGDMSKTSSRQETPPSTATANAAASANSSQ